MSKKNNTPKNPVTVQGSKKPVGLNKDILKPLTQSFNTQAGQVRPGEEINKGAFNEFKEQIKKLAADGTLDESDLQSLQSFQTSERGKHYEPLLRQEGLTQALTDARYDAQIQNQIKGFTDFRQQQTGIINKALSDQVSFIDTMLNEMRADSSSALSGYIQDITKAQDKMNRLVDRQTNLFERGNERSKRNIERFQDNIAKLPKPPKPTKQISDKITGVDAGDPFEKLAVNRAPIAVQSAPALTGFSQSQQESRARQIQGLSGFRSSRT